MPVEFLTDEQAAAYEHAWEIRDAHGYHPFEDAEWGRKFRAFLHGRAWTVAEGPVALFNQAVGWLRRHRVLLPGVSVPAKQVAAVRQVAEKRLYATVAGRAAGGRVAAGGPGGAASGAGRAAGLGAGAVSPAADADDGREHGECPGAGG